MIPLQLTLKNFLSYRETTLDFRGLHTACICGPNGAGKSSLLEAITWVIWGQSRAESEDDIIHAGAKDVRVDFIFQNNQQTHRIIRTRNRGQSSSLEFQIQTAGGFRSLTEKGVRATQQLILHHLKLDYETFINSAYLRQGRADEFMLRRPNERKQILADLLKLDRYEELAEQAKDLSRQFKGQAEQLEQSLQTIKQQLEQRDATLEQQSLLEITLQQLQQAQDTDQKQIQQLQAVQHQRSTWQQQLTFVRQQYHNLSQDCDRLGQDIAATEAQQRQLASLLNQDEQIKAGYSQYINLQQQEEIFTAKFQAYQEAQQLHPQEQEIQETLSRSGEVAAAMERLNLARRRLSGLDSLQLQVSPLLQRRSSLQ